MHGPLSCVCELLALLHGLHACAFLRRDKPRGTALSVRGSLRQAWESAQLNQTCSVGIVLELHVGCTGEACQREVSLVWFARLCSRRNKSSTRWTPTGAGKSCSRSSVHGFHALRCGLKELP
eukprot:1948472-Amphidinium_carterae.2